VIPSHLRTTAYSLDTCVAGVLGFASSPLVGVLAQRAGYRQAFDPHAQAPAAAAAESVRNARALEDSLLLISLVACGAKFVVRAGQGWRRSAMQAGTALAHLSLESSRLPVSGVCSSCAICLLPPIRSGAARGQCTAGTLRTSTRRVPPFSHANGPHLSSAMYHMSAVL